MTKKKDSVSASLLHWYDTHQRVLPWRAGIGQAANPYHVLVSEFMLQQTTVTAVIPYFTRFIKRWPTLKALAKAAPDDVRAMWAGLGYYRRARFLHEAAQAIVKDFKGAIPHDEKTLRSLPGIGAYTAAAIVAITFNQKANVVDGNVERVVARLSRIETPLPKAKKILYEKAARLVPEKRGGDYAQALMDLGSTICTPRRPLCRACPIKKFCAAGKADMAEHYPRRMAAKKTPDKYAVFFILRDARGRFLMRQRPESGLLASMWEFPSTPWQEKKPNSTMIARHAPAQTIWHEAPAKIHHVFSHFKLNGTLRMGHKPAAFMAHHDKYCWIAQKQFGNMGLPSLMQKIAALVQRHKGTFP